MAIVTVEASNDQWTPGVQGVHDYDKIYIEGTGSPTWTFDLRHTELECAYPPDYPANHVFDIMPGTPRLPGLCLAVIAVEAGTTPTDLFGGDRSKWFLPHWYAKPDLTTRYFWFYPSDMSNSSGWAGPWDIYFGFTDGRYDDNAGQYVLDVTVTNVGDQSINEILGRGGALTDEDRENASVCGRTGILTPANRLEDVDGRVVFTNIAPWCKRQQYEYGDN